jgi:hypothetical protein
MAGSNTRSNLLGTLGAGLPFIGAALGIAAITGVTGCHLEVLIIPVGLLFAGAIAAVFIGAVAIRARRSKRGLIMPCIAIATGLGSIVALGFLIA